MIREFASVDGVDIEIRVTGVLPAPSHAEFVAAVHAVAGRVCRAHRESLPVPEPPAAEFEPPLEVIDRVTPWGTARIERYPAGDVATIVGETTILAGPDAGEVVREVMVRYSNGRDPRQRLDMPALSPRHDMSKKVEIIVNRFPSTPAFPDGATDPELEDAQRWASYGEARLGPVERLQRDRERQTREAEAAALAAENAKRAAARQEAHEVALWLAGRVLGELEGKPGLPGPEPKRSILR